MYDEPDVIKDQEHEHTTDWKDETIILSKVIPDSPEDDHSTICMSNQELEKYSYIPHSQRRNGGPIAKVWPKKSHLTEKKLQPFVISPIEKEYHEKFVKDGNGSKRYHIDGVTDEGGMGVILDVKEQNLYRRVAMKVLQPGLKNSPEVLSRFVTEGKITGYLEHPNIMTVHELGALDATGIFFTMKFSEGENCKDIIDKLGSGIPEFQKKYNTYHLLNIFRKVCDAVSYAHSMNVVHLDIKPHNIMVGKFGEVILMDWGISKVFGDPDSIEDPQKKQFLLDMYTFQKEKESQIEGSPPYMAPEQASGQISLLGTATDVFLLGATLYHLFTLEYPYEGKNLNATLANATRRNLIPPDKRVPGRQIPAEICRIILKAMEFDQAHRYHTVSELSADIDNFLAGKWSQQRTKTFNSGETIIKEGEKGEEAYLILDGSAVITRETGDGEKVVFATCGVGDLIGEMALISQDPRSTSVQAQTKTTVAVITRNLIDDGLQKLPPYMEKIVRSLNDRLRSSTKLMHPYLSKDPTFVILKQLSLLLTVRKHNNTELKSIPVHELVAEIAADLGLPVHIVGDIIDKAGQAGLIAVYNGSVEVPMSQ